MAGCGDSPETVKAVVRKVPGGHRNVLSREMVRKKVPLRIDYSCISRHYSTHSRQPAEYRGRDRITSLSGQLVNHACEDSQCVRFPGLSANFFRALVRFGAHTECLSHSIGVVASAGMGEELDILARAICAIVFSTNYVQRSHYPRCSLSIQVTYQKEQHNENSCITGGRNWSGDY